MDKGFFGGLFDVNHDGKLDAFERTMDFMDEDERREVLEDAGLDPDDYDF